MAHLMTLEEVLAAPDAIVEICREDGMEWHLGMILSTEIASNGNITIAVANTFPIFPAAEYGKTWRCWAYDEIIREMEKTPWTTKEEG